MRGNGGAHSLRPHLSRKNSPSNNWQLQSVRPRSLGDCNKTSFMIQAGQERALACGQSPVRVRECSSQVGDFIAPCFRIGRCNPGSRRTDGDSNFGRPIYFDCGQPFCFEQVGLALWRARRAEAEMSESAWNELGKFAPRCEVLRAGACPGLRGDAPLLTRSDDPDIAF
jgi:hypothetical protein